MARYNWLIVGAGFTGATLAEQIATRLGQKVLVIDRRDHIAGNAYDHPGPHGILVHKYGPHIFHTNSDKVWRYLSRFTEWEPYFHKVLASVDGNFVPVPFNLNSMAACFPPYLAEDLARALIGEYGFGKKIPILSLRGSQSETVKFLADYVYDKVFKNYTFKQWALQPEELDNGVTARVPIALSRDDRYFQDIYQAMPKDGYTRMFERILDHPLIDVALESDFFEIADSHKDAKIIFTGPIDEYFRYKYGPLPYRSLRFEFDEEPTARVQPVGTVNYPNEYDFTRITEIGHLNGVTASSTILVKEYPQAYVAGENEPYYPIPTPGTSELLAPYLAEARSLKGKVWFAGRLGDYAYYNMDQACARALALFEKEIAGAAP